MSLEPPRRQRPPRNRAQAWFLVLLWFVPTGFALASAVGLGWINEKVFANNGTIPVVLGFSLNIAFVIGTGWFTTQLSTRARTEPGVVASRVFAFFMIQLFLIPILLALIVFCACLIDPINI